MVERALRPPRRRPLLDPRLPKPGDEDQEKLRWQPAVPLNYRIHSKNIGTCQNTRYNVNESLRAKCRCQYQGAARPGALGAP